jgi:hypothetical protein
MSVAVTVHQSQVDSCFYISQIVLPVHAPNLHHTVRSINVAAENTVDIVHSCVSHGYGVVVLSATSCNTRRVFSIQFYSIAVHVEH